MDMFLFPGPRPAAKSVALPVLALVIALGRFAIPGHGLSWAGSYEAFAHISVGALMLLSLRRETRWATLPYLIGLSLLELVMFVLR